MAEPYRLLKKFRLTFEGHPYRHRASNLGDLVALELYEDIYSLRSSRTYNQRVDGRIVGINTDNQRRGVRARRGDGTLGELVRAIESSIEDGYSVARGQVATVEIGVEVKILSKAMNKQVGRVQSDIRDQLQHFRRGKDNPLTVGIVGINRAEKYLSFEGAKEWPTTGKAGHPHPIQEADRVEEKVRRELESELDELLILRYRATNFPPYEFEWVNPAGAVYDYGALITRLARNYESRFGRT